MKLSQFATIAVLAGALAVSACANTIKGVGKDDPIKVAAWLHSHSVETPIGDLAWNKQGDLKSFKFDVFTWHKDGSKTVFK